MVFLYTDGGSDHRATYLSVKLTMISLFRYLNLDYLCAARTAPYHSFRNPAERVMSVLNLGVIISWTGILNEIDAEFTLSSDEKITHQKLTPGILSFMKHRSHERHYFLILRNVEMKIVTYACHQGFHLTSFCSSITCQTQCLVKMNITRNFSRFFILPLLKIIAPLFKITLRNAYPFTHQFNM